MFAYLKKHEHREEQQAVEGRCQEEQQQHRKAKPAKPTPSTTNFSQQHHPLLQQPLKQHKHPKTPQTQEKKKKAVVSSSLVLLDCSKDLQAICTILEALSKLAAVENSETRETLQKLKSVLLTVSQTVATHAGYVSPVGSLSYAHSRLNKKDHPNAEIHVTIHEMSLKDMRRQVDQTTKQKRVEKWEKENTKKENAKKENKKRQHQKQKPSLGESNHAPSSTAPKSPRKKRATTRKSPTARTTTTPAATGGGSPSPSILSPATASSTAARKRALQDSIAPVLPTTTAASPTKKTKLEENLPPGFRVPPLGFRAPPLGIRSPPLLTSTDALKKAITQKTVEARLCTTVTAKTTIGKRKHPTSAIIAAALSRTENSNGNAATLTITPKAPPGFPAADGTSNLSFAELGRQEMRKQNPAKPSAKAIELRARYDFPPPADGTEYTPREFYRIFQTNVNTRKAFIDCAIESCWIPCGRSTAYRLLKKQESELPARWNATGRPTVPVAASKKADNSTTTTNDAVNPSKKRGPYKPRKVVPKMEIPPEIPKPKDGKEYTPLEFFNMVQPYISTRTVGRAIDAVLKNKYIPVSKITGYRIASKESPEEVPMRWNTKGRPPIITVGELKEQLPRQDMTRQELREWLAEKRQEQQSQRKGVSASAPAPVSINCAKMYETLLSVMDMDKKKPSKTSNNNETEDGADEIAGGSV